LPIIEAIENIGAPPIEKPSNDNALSDTEEATAKPYTLQQTNKTKALAKIRELGLSGEPKSPKEFAAMFPDHFEYDQKNTKLSYKNPKR